MGLPQELRPGSEVVWDVEAEPTFNRYTRVSDRNGNSDEVRARVPPDTSRLISKIVQQRRIPVFETRADLVRAGVHIILEMIESEGLLDVEDAVMLHEEKNEDRQMRREAWIRKTEEYIERSRELLRIMERRGDRAGIYEEVEGLKERAEMTREPYKGEMLALVAEHGPKAREPRGPRKQQGQ